MATCHPGTVGAGWRSEFSPGTCGSDCSHHTVTDLVTKGVAQWDESPLCHPLQRETGTDRPPLPSIPSISIAVKKDREMAPHAELSAIVGSFTLISRYSADEDFSSASLQNLDKHT